MVTIEAMEALWFFLPAFAANQCPGLGVYCGIPSWPVSRRLLGENKTVEAYVVAVAGASFVVFLEQDFVRLNNVYGWYHAESISEVLLIGTLFGVGAVLGDHVKSFYKRRRGIRPGEPWWPFDQIDFAVGALVCIFPLSGWIGFGKVAFLLLASLFFRPVLNWFGWKMGIRKTWK